MPPAKKPPAPRRKAAAPPVGAVEAAVKRDLSALPDDLAKSGLAASAVAMAQSIDHPGSSFTAKSMCQARLADAMRELRELAPPVEKKGELHDIKSRRALRLATGE
jgi:hypothetical protein